MGHQAIVLICSFLAITLALCPRRKRNVGTSGPETPKPAAGESARPAPPAVSVPVMADPVSHALYIGSTGGAVLKSTNGGRQLHSTASR
jgi:hypothetical protein